MRTGTSTGWSLPGARSGALATRLPHIATGPRRRKMDRPSVTESELLRASLMSIPALLFNVRFCYQSDDPFAIQLTIDCDGQAITWTFSRELLELGLYAGVGRGDVIV